MSDADAFSPSTTCQTIRDRADLPLKLLEGAKAMQDQLKKWAPETKADWEIRQAWSELIPFYTDAANDAASVVLANPIGFEDDVPVEIRGDADRRLPGLKDAITRSRMPIDDFMVHVVKRSIAVEGVSYILVDHPRVPDGASAADAGSVRPYWCQVYAHDLLDDVRDETGRRVEVRILERIAVKKGFEEEKEIEQVRHIFAGGVEPQDAEVATAFEKARLDRSLARFAIWRKEESDNAIAKIVAAGAMKPQTEIPIVPYYTGYEGKPGLAKAPYASLARLCRSHYRKLSDLDHHERKALMFVWHRTGVTEDQMKAQAALMGSMSVWFSENPDARAEALELTGSAAASARIGLESLERRILAATVRPHAERTGNETATGRRIDTAEATTEVEAWAIAAQRAIDEALLFTAKYLSANAETGGHSVVRPGMRYAKEDLERAAFAKNLMIDLMKAGMPADGAIGMIVEEIKRHGGLSADFDGEAFAELLGRPAGA